MRRLLIDVSSILRACHHTKKDVEFGYSVKFEGKDVWVNSGDYAYELFMVSYAKVLREYSFKPYETVLVLDGVNSRQLRKSFFPDYKGNRPQRPDEINKEYNDALEGVIDEITGLGGICCYQEAREADDVLAYLSQNLAGRMVIWSRDGDMLALRTDSVDILLKDEFNPEAYQNCPAQYVTLYKALVGDKSDNFKGAIGFGPKSFFDMLMLFGFEGLDNLQALIKSKQLDKLVEDVSEFKPLQKIIDSADSVYTSWMCAQFYPSRINLSESPLEIRMSVVEVRDEWHPLMQTFAPSKSLITSQSGLDALKSDLKLSPRVALDIETSTPEESDIWVEGIAEIKSSKKGVPLDVLGSKLTGLSLTYGANLEKTCYIPVDHRDSINVKSEALADVIESIPVGTELLIHNTSFELPVLFLEWGGWLDGAVDTMLMKSYVDENTSLGLKPSSKKYFGYTQTSYEQVTTVRGPKGTIPAGGKPVKKATKAQIDAGTRSELPDGWEERQYKMKELTAEHVFNYACDDTICTASLYNRLRFTMELEHTWEAFKEIELPAQYWKAEAFVNGIDVDWEHLQKIADDDAKAFDKGMATLKDYLLSISWKGSEYTPIELTTDGVKRAWDILVGGDLRTSAKTVKGLANACKKAGGPAWLTEAILAEDVEQIAEVCQESFVPNPDFSLTDGNIRELMYDVWKLPVRFRTVVTKAQRLKGVKQGAPQVDKYAFNHALKFDLKEGSDRWEILTLIRDLTALQTRNNLYYKPYPAYKHWTDSKLRTQAGQCKTVTRRDAPSHINIAQLPKRGGGKKVRACLKAPKGYVWISADWSSQELALIGYRSQDEAMLSCFVGDDKKDPHSITGASIAKLKGKDFGEYRAFVILKQSGDVEVALFRDLGKATNFATAFGCKVPKLAKMLTIVESEAKVALDAKEAAYPGIKRWSLDTIAEARRLGYVKTLKGVRRHLYTDLTNPDKWVQLGAERQAINFTIQGSAAEQCKLAINKLFSEGLFERYDAKFMFTVHDQGDFVVKKEHASAFIMEMHKIMTQPYGGMDFNINSDVSVGLNFGDQHEIGIAPTPELVEEVLSRL